MSDIIEVLKARFRPTFFYIGSALGAAGVAVSNIGPDISPKSPFLFALKVVLFGSAMLAFVNAFYHHKPERCKLLPKWDTDAILSRIREMQDGEELRLINTYIPEMERLISTLKDLFLKENRDIAVKVLLLDWSRARNLLESRMSLRPDSVESAVGHIQSNAWQLNKLKRLVLERRAQSRDERPVKIEVRLFDHMPLGGLYQVGQRAMGIMFFFADKSGVAGPSLYCENLQSEKYGAFVESFNTSWKADSTHPYEAVG